ncbi:hypothetical protein GCM10017783_25660 [Deinococcus piscis]|uniref:Uncharacterized protein n=1 Tax=Deinococcus piscis TaxID=394230 RepID=A0ABQ3KDB7_9DEIO|nr:hypothetical protein [Deinococcus piscis]GHG12454.1 hypothetical protein GCM10017783_25660 [Deinococcus piscis]
MDNTYLLLLTAHSWVRWLVLLTGIWALVNAFSGVRARGPMTSRAPFASFMGSIHLQVLLGLALFAMMGMGGMAPFPDGPRDSFGWEHLGLGLLAAVFATMANRAAKAPARAAPVFVADGTPAPTPTPAAVNDEITRWRGALLWTILAWIPLLLAIPWWRPVLRMFGQ